MPVLEDLKHPPAGIVAGQLTFWDHTNGKWVTAETSEIVWDDANKRLGINTAAPTAAVHVASTGTTVRSLILTGVASQTADYILIQNSGASTVFKVDVNGAISINEQGADADSVIAGNSIANLLKIDAGNDHVETHGGRIEATTRITDSDSPYTVLNTDHVIFCDTDGGAITVNLQAGTEGRHLKIINCGSSGNDLTVDPNGTEQLYGAGAGIASTLADGEVINIHYNATEGWW